MNDQSPPKRVTRARAAAKTNDAAITTTKIATAASKAKLTRATSTSKRKTRSDETHDEDEQQQEPDEIIEPEPTRSTRGRSKRIVAQAPVEMEEDAPAPPPTRATRGRPKKAPAEAPAPEPPKTTRTRAKKIEVPAEEEVIVVEDPPKRTTRTRAATLTKATAPKKTVKFEEPDKENVIPPTATQKTKAKAAEVGTGLKAKPVRKPAAAATRTTRGRSKAVVEEKKETSSPLSPKKVTQVGATKDSTSDDELATTEKTPMKALMRSPVKPPGSIFGTAKKIDFSNPIIANKATTTEATPGFGASVMASPARRPPQSPFKDSIKASPQRANLGDSMLKSPFKPSLSAPTTAPGVSPFKQSLLQSPARRPQSPMKVTDNGSPSRTNNTKSFLNGTPKANTFKMSRFATPSNLTKSAIRPGTMPHPRAFTNLTEKAPLAKDSDATTELNAQPSLKFSGRLSSIIPRAADPAFASADSIVEGTEDEQVVMEPAGEPMELDTVETILAEEFAEDKTTTPTASPSRNSTGAYALREEDENPFVDSDSEDELAAGVYSPRDLGGFRISTHDFAPTTPTPFTAISKTPRTAKSRMSMAPGQSARKEKLGFTPLAQQLSQWMAASPEKSEEVDNASEPASPTAMVSKNTVSEGMEPALQPSPAKSSFFDDEMSVRDELASVPEPEAAEIFEPEFSPIELDDEDLELAQEADKMSMLEPDLIETNTDQEVTAQETVVEGVPTEQTTIVQADIEEVHLEEMPIVEVPIEQGEEAHVQAITTEEAVEEEPLVHEPAPSEASQEYGDENAMPLDPALFAAPVVHVPAAQTFSTPKRVLAERICHTVSKVPLKAAAEVTPMRPPPQKRSASISRLPAQRPTSGLARSNTVISYSPTKSTPRKKTPRKSIATPFDEGRRSPSKEEEEELWSNLGTPARSPHKDLNPALLKGAVVFVDVHTTEGADASILFTELLTQMGARCLKSWNWNGKTDDGNKIGITHVVFKDGGKRTLEKAKECGSVVSCVGVGWVLDCERENKWLDEAAYAVDTAMVPRGGHRRRKSMEPRALANLNGTLVPSSTTTPARTTNTSPTKDFLSLPDTPFTSKSKRRDSVQWQRSPSTDSPDSDKIVDEQSFILSPVPATPAFSAYADPEETPGGQTPYFLKNEQLVQKTAPPAKGRYFGTPDSKSDTAMESGFLSEKKDESVMMRLMAARRKSLQFAPKIGSPLAKGI